MDILSKSIKRFFPPVKPLPSGIYHFQAPAEDPRNYRLHLRVDADGSGMLVLNASTILHLNQTAAEYAYHVIKNTSEETVARVIAARYKVQPNKALQDFQEFKETIDLLVSRDDLDPEIFLDLEPTKPEELDIPLRLDCALTYNLPGGVDPLFSPAGRVVKELDTQTWRFILDKAWNDFIPHIIFTGGESTLREDLPELIQHAERNGQVTGLLTDGHKLSNPVYLDQLLQSGLDHLLYLLQPGNEQSWMNLESVVKADLFVTAHITLAAKNVNLLPSVLDRLASLDLQALSLSANDRSLADPLTRLTEQAANINLRLVWDLPVPFSAFNPVALTEQPNDPASYSRKSWLYIEPDGDVRTSQESAVVLGNILSDPIQDLWKPVSVSTDAN